MLAAHAVVGGPDQPRRVVPLGALAGHKNLERLPEFTGLRLGNPVKTLRADGLDRVTVSVMI